MLSTGFSGIVRALTQSVSSEVGSQPGGERSVLGERSLLIDGAAQLLGVSRRTVYYRIREGRLCTIRTKCGSQRVLLSSIERLLQEIKSLP